MLKHNKADILFKNRAFWILDNLERTLDAFCASSVKRRMIFLINKEPHTFTMENKTKVSL